MVNLTKHTLQKLEVLLGELGYVIRYEKGNFNSGYCIVEQRNIIVVNKFFETEARASVLLDILGSLSFDPGILGEKSARFYEKIKEDKMPAASADGTSASGGS
ncbi:MAG: hypothetical protein RLY31_1191 [Bacteroidota bacterium]|jgi:hypothetical protein